MPRTIEFEGRRIEVPDDATDAEVRQILASPPALTAGAGIIEAELFDGTVLEFPEGTAPDVIQRVAKEQTAKRKAGGPWEKYKPSGKPAAGGPWEKYAQQQATAPAPTAPAASFPFVEVEAPDGTIVEFPAGMTDEAMAAVMQRHYGGSAPAPAPAIATAPATSAALSQPWQDGVPVGGIGSTAPKPRGDDLVDTIMASTTNRSTGDHATGLVRSGAEGFNKGLAGVAGLPVDAMNAALMLANLFPGVDGVGPISDEPIGGSDWLIRPPSSSRTSPGMTFRAPSFRRSSPRCALRWTARLRQRPMRRNRHPSCVPCARRAIRPFRSPSPSRPTT